MERINPQRAASSGWVEFPDHPASALRLALPSSSYRTARDQLSLYEYADAVADLCTCIGWCRETRHRTTSLNREVAY
jgi:hypothetical protein